MIVPSTEKILEKLAKRYLWPLQSAAHIVIRDIIVAQQLVDKEDSFKNPEVYQASGEYEVNQIIDAEEYNKLLKESRTTLLRRVKDTITELAVLAWCQHEKDNFFESTAGQFKVKPGRENHVTRLLTSEFMFYPLKKQGPFNTAEFNELIGFLEDLAECLPINLHLILGTFPLLTRGDILHNVSIFIQCGKNPVIKVTAKYLTDTIDPDYENPYCKQQKQEIIKASDVADMKGDSVNLQTSTMNFASQTKCVTAGNACYSAITEICADQLYDISRRFLLHDAKHNVITTHVSHLVSSNSIDIDQKKLLSAYQVVSQADPYSLKLHASKPELAVLENEEELPVRFGHVPLIVKTYKPFTLPPLKRKLCNEVKEHNNLMLKRKALEIVKQQRPFDDHGKLEDEIARTPVPDVFRMQK